MDGKNKLKFSKKASKILIPLLIVVAIGGIWFFKNSNKTPIVKGDNPAFELHVTDRLDLKKLKSYGLPIIIDFGADSCIPCREMAPVLKQLNEELRGKAIIVFVDVWKYKSLANGYPISVIPTQVFYDKLGNPYIPKNPETLQMGLNSMKSSSGQTFTTHEGGMTKAQLLRILKEMGVE